MRSDSNITLARRVSAFIVVLSLCCGIVVVGNVKSMAAKAGLANENIANSSQEPTDVFSKFCNQSTININDHAPASSYPSSINVSGLTGFISKITVTLSGLQHTFPDDVDILLVGPQGQKVELMSDAGGNRSISNAELSFDDDAPSYLPDFGTITSGTYKPSNFFEQSDAFPVPAPATTVTAPYGATMLSFNGANPNGNWSLYVVDDCSGDAGQIVNGWCLSIATSSAGGPLPSLISGAINSSDPTEKGRLARNTINSLNTSPKGFPGVTDSATRHFDSYTLTNQSDSSQTVTATLSSTCGANIFMAAYSDSYDPNNLSTNYLADNGSSFVNTGLPMSFDVPAGAACVIVVNEISSNSGCASYSLLVEGNVSFNTTPPQIIKQPSNQTTPLGRTASFNVSASGNGLTYRWRKGSALLDNGGNVAGADTPNLTISSVSSNDVADNYNVVVTGLSGTVTSNNAALMIDKTLWTIACSGIFAKAQDCTTANVSGLRPRSIEQGVLNSLVTLRAGAKDKRDADRLEDAIKHLANSIDATLWLDDSHPQRKGGEKVFREARETANRLLEIMNDKRVSINDLKGIVLRLVLANRIIALLAVNDGGNSNKINRPNDELSKGDTDATAGRYDSAMDHYRNAWNQTLK
jgi:subtilisin-like proprotein convertase family protein